MLYLGTSPCDENVADMLNHHKIGLMCQPGSNRPRPGWLWAADNGCFAAKWDEHAWLRWLDVDHPRAGCLFAVVPDVVADHEGTVERFHQHRASVTERRYPVAFVAQDGATPDNIPWADLDCLFIGGTTEWKMSPAAFSAADAARERGRWVHVGRVNSRSRYRAWADHADSADGTFLAFGPSKNAPKVAGWVEDHWRNPSLFAQEAQ